MKRVSLILMVLLATTLVSAQRGGSNSRGERPGGEQRMSPEERQAQELDTLTKVLSLSEEQRTKIEELQENQRKAFEENREAMSENTDREAMREKMMAMREKYEEDMKSILTPEQVEKYDAYQKKREEEMKEMMEGGGGPGGPGGGPGGPGGSPPF